MPTTGTVLYLSSADIDELELTPHGVENTVESAYQALALGKAASVPKVGFNCTPSTFFHAMPARYDAKGTVGLKWIGTADNSAEELPHINSIIILGDLRTAVVKAIMDGTQITAIRPAAVSLVAARHLARRDSYRLGFIACGLQGTSHMKAFAEKFPIREVTGYSLAQRNGRGVCRTGARTRRCGIRNVQPTGSRRASGHHRIKRVARDV